MYQVKVLALLAAMVLFQQGCGDHDDELRKIPDYMKLVKTIEHDKAFKGFAPMLAWRLVIDGQKQNEGPLVFDKEEPGYLAGLSRGLNYALKHQNDSLTVEFIEELRRQATEEVAKTNDTSFNKEIGGNGTRFNLIMDSNMSKDGLAEFEEKVKNDPLRTIGTEADGGRYLSRKAADRATLSPHVKKILDTYENSKKTIRDIVILSQDLDQLHPFNDGNVRTFVILLAQKELLRNNFTPAIWENPNRFDAFSVNELVQEVAEGQRLYKSYLGI